MSDPNTMTACESLCRDFVWVGPFTEWLRNAAVVVGVGVGWYQLGAWRREKRDIRRSEIAEEAISSAYGVWDALDHIRFPLISVPREEINNERFSDETRAKRIADSNDRFAELRQSQIRVRAVIGDAEVDAAIDSLFRARSDIATAIQIRADYAGDNGRTTEEREHLIQLRRTVSGTGGKGDELGRSIKDSVKTIETKLNPVARLEQKK